MSEYIITDMQAKEIADHLPTFYLPTWLYKWAESKTVNVGKAAYQVNDVHVSVNLPEIVHCRDCKYYRFVDRSGIFQDQYHNDSFCSRFVDGKRMEVEPDGFCAWASRKEVD